MRHQNEVEEICQIARSFLQHVEELRSTLEVMQASLEQTVDQSNLSPKEKEVLKHITQKVSPIGLQSLLEAIELTARRTASLRTDTYKDLAASLSRTIYQQAGVAGPSGERTFNNKHDAQIAASKEVAKAKVVMDPPKVELPPVKKADEVPETIPRTRTESSNAKAKYNQYINQYPILRNLVKKPKEPPSEIHAWAIACGYEMTDSISAQATLEKGIDALLWPSDNGVNAVEKVHILPHPSKNGKVYILTMEKDTTSAQHVPGISNAGKESSHLSIECVTWCSPEYPKHIVVEISSKLSKESPFKQKRRGWEEVERYLTSTNPRQGQHLESPTRKESYNQVHNTYLNNDGEISSTRNSSRSIANPKHHITTI